MYIIVKQVLFVYLLNEYKWRWYLSVKTRRGTKLNKKVKLFLCLIN
jgi:hypothetical protein